MPTYSPKSNNKRDKYAAHIDVRDVAESIRIPIPERSPRARGINATTTIEAKIATRVAPQDKELILDEAAWLDMSPAMFIRWCALYAARALKERREGKRVNIDV